MKTTKLKLEDIRIDGGTQPRVWIDTEAVSEYADAIASLPPVTVFYDGVDYWLADGFHRWHAHAKAKKKTLDAEVRKGTQRDAILFSVGANREHGLRRTNKDKRKAVETLLEDPEWEKRSDRWIAEQCGVGRDLVAEIRRGEDESTVGTDSSNRTGATKNAEKPIREGKDGKARKLPELEPEEPEFHPCPECGRQTRETGKCTICQKAEKWAGPVEKASDDLPDTLFDTTPEPRQAADPVKDQTDRVITDPEIARIFQRRAESTGFMRTLSSIKSQITKAMESGDPYWYDVNLSRLQADFDNLHRALRFAAPYAVCRYCNGRGDGCKACQDHGWLSEARFNTVPREMR